MVESLNDWQEGVRRPAGLASFLFYHSTAQPFRLSGRVGAAPRAALEASILGSQVSATGSGAGAGISPGPVPEPEHLNLIPDGRDLGPENESAAGWRPRVGAGHRHALSSEMGAA